MDGEELYTGGDFTGVQLDVHAFFIKLHTHYLLGTNDLPKVIGKFIIYPDPNQGIFTLEGTLNESGKDLYISIYNSIGEKVADEKENNSGFTFRKNFDLSSMNAGIYFIRVSDGVNYFNSKFIKVN